MAMEVDVVMMRHSGSTSRLAWLLCRPLNPFLSIDGKTIELYIPEMIQVEFLNHYYLEIQPETWQLVLQWNEYMYSQVFLDGSIQFPIQVNHAYVAPMTVEHTIDMEFMIGCLDSMTKPLVEMKIGAIIEHSTYIYRIENVIASEDTPSDEASAWLLVIKQAQSKPKALHEPKITSIRKTKKRTHILISPTSCHVHPLSELWRECRWVPTILYKLDIHRRQHLLQAKLDWPHDLSVALTAANGSNNRLAFLGDAILKVIVSYSLLVSKQVCDELVRQERHQILQNAVLAGLAQGSIHLSELIDLDGFKTWSNVGQPLPEISPLRSKVIATAVEAIVASVYLSHDFSDVIHVCNRLDICEYFQMEPLLALPAQLTGYQHIQAIMYLLPHDFQTTKWRIICEILIEGSYRDNPREEIHGILEWCRFLGEAIGYFAIAKQLFNRPQDFKPSVMTLIRNQLTRQVIGDILVSTAILQHTEAIPSWHGHCWDCILGIVALDSDINSSLALFDALTRDTVEQLIRAVQ